MPGSPEIAELPVTPSVELHGNKLNTAVIIGQNFVKNGFLDFVSRLEFCQLS